eukprot:2377638-Prymnesium_polylepis.1
MTSPLGRCQTFDDRADGYARGETCCAAALSCEVDEIEHEIRVPGCAVRQDGKSASLTAPNGAAQRALIALTIAKALVTPSDYSYVEAHGTGTTLGDPQEMSAMVMVLGSAEDTLCVSSIKSNVGHTELSAGLTGLLKMVLQGRQAKLAPNAQLRKLNKHVGILLCDVRCVLGVQASGSSTHEARLTSGVSSFGWSGTIAHLVAQMSLQAQSEGTALMNFTRRSFPWRTPAAHSAQHENTGTYMVCWTARNCKSASATVRANVLLLNPFQPALDACTSMQLSTHQPWALTAVLIGDPSASPSVRGTQIVFALTQMLIVRSQPPQL